MAVPFSNQAEEKGVDEGARQPGDAVRRDVRGPWKERLPEVVDVIMRTLEDRGTVGHVCTYALPHQDVIVLIINLLSRLLFPGYFGEKAMHRANLEFHLRETANIAFDLLCEEIAKCLVHAGAESSKEARERCAQEAQRHAFDLLGKFPALIDLLDGDVRAAYLGDPAATGSDEIVVCYPGFRALLIFRIAHELHVQGVPLLPRVMTEHAHQHTGIDIHPGATIGRNFFIDHGTGVVIGETTQIGENVKMYQGVTLGALSFPTDEHGDLRRGFKRHPTIEDEVVIYSNATILGAVTIGGGSVIGGNVFLTHSVEPHSKVTREGPGHRIRKMRRRAR